MDCCRVLVLGLCFLTFQGRTAGKAGGMVVASSPRPRAVTGQLGVRAAWVPWRAVVWVSWKPWASARGLRP